MKKQPKKENKPNKLSEQATENAHTSGFIREAISESRSFVKEVTRGKHTGVSVQPSHSSKKHRYCGI